jgi:DNA recombination protein RmuC
MDFAFMFIPHEAIYYDLLVNKIGTVTAETENILQVAAGKYHVICVSPTSFSAYLQTGLLRRSKTVWRSAMYDLC